MLPDREEHRRRVEAREADIPGHEVPTWEAVDRGEWQEWESGRDREQLLADTSESTDAVAGVLARLGP